ncbi:Uncharacterized protein FKW44_013029, partial [Caligus rogercresseyi]
SSKSLQKNNSGATIQRRGRRATGRMEARASCPRGRTESSRLNVPVIEHKAGKTLKINGVDCVDWATHNYLGFAGNEDIEEAAIECIQQYGVGSCGPRAFYGTAGLVS